MSNAGSGSIDHLALHGKLNLTLDTEGGISITAIVRIRSTVRQFNWLLSNLIVGEEIWFSGRPVHDPSHRPADMRTIRLGTPP